MSKLQPDDVLRVLRQRAPRALHLGEIQTRLYEDKDQATADRPRLITVLDSLIEEGRAQEMPGLRFRFVRKPVQAEPPAPPAAHAPAKPHLTHAKDHPKDQSRNRSSGGSQRNDSQGRGRGSRDSDRRSQGRRDSFPPPAPTQDAARSPWQRPEARAATVEGYLTVTPRGFGFVAAEDGGPDVFISPTAMGPALHGDKVECQTRPSAKGREGLVVGILARRSSRVTGILRASGKRYFVEPDDLRLGGPMDLVEPPPKEAKIGDVVDAQIVRFPQRSDDRPGVLVEGVLGVQGITAVEVAKIKIRENIQEEFPPAVLAEASSIPTRVAAADKLGREDLRELDLCTIDPADARDHDDALFIERIKRGGGYRVLIAIADVSHYVRPGTAIDEEAQARCCSIYLPDRVIPMLPHELSSNLASLVPKRDRLCLAVDITLDKAGQVVRHRYVEGLMRSSAKLHYEGVAEALGLTKEGKQNAARDRLPMLQALHELAKLLREKRLKRGALDFDLPEPRVKLDDEGEPIDVVRSRKDPGVREAYRIVEEMMLLANEVVATDLSERNIPAIYRTHGAPSVEKLETFCELATSLGETLEPEDAQDPKKLTEFLASIEGEPTAPVLRYLLLRAMQQAIYDTNDVGHFGLAAKHYLHFTSPIRRYPDLAVHRVVRSLARGEFVDGALLLPKLRKMAARSSQLERRAMTVERDVVSLYRCLVMRDKVGEELPAVISGLDESGFYASLETPFVDVFVPAERLTDDYYAVDRLGVRLVGSRGGRVFEMGQSITIRVVSVGLERRRVEAELVGVDQELRAKGGRGKQRTRQRAASSQRPEAADGSPRKRGKAQADDARKGGNKKKGGKKKAQEPANSDKKGKKAGPRKRKK